MKFKLVMCYAIVMFCSRLVIAETDYWQVIKEYLTNPNPTETLSGEWVEYMESLTAEELLIAARQCSAEMESSVPSERWDMASIALGFFYEHYPRKTNNVEGISPLLNDLKDKSQPIFWRRYIMNKLGGSWPGELDAEQSLNASKIVYKIYSDDLESLLLKPKAIRNSTELLVRAYYINLQKDPNFKQFTTKHQKMGTRELVNAVRAGNVKLLQQTIEANEKVLAEINKAITKQLSLLSRKQVDASIKTSIIVAFARYHECHLDPPQVSQALANAINDYKNYDKELWYLLARTNVIVFGNQNAGIKLQEMIDEDEGLKKRLKNDERLKTHLKSLGGK